MIAKWVSDFRTAGPDALRPKWKGRKKTLDKYKEIYDAKPVEEKNVNTSAEIVKELEDELLKLRIENIFLKELRRLRLEDEVKMRERRKSSTVSGRRFKLKDLLSYTGMPKVTYMYWQKQADRENPDKEREEKIFEIRKENKDYGYRRIFGELHK